MYFKSQNILNLTAILFMLFFQSLMFGLKAMMYFPLVHCSVPADGVGMSLECVGQPESPAPCQMTGGTLDLGQHRIDSSILWKFRIL